MSEEKLYAVKNDEGEWLSFNGTEEEIWYSNNPTLFKDKSYAEAQSMGRKAHVVELVELVEPEKVVLTKEQAEIVEKAHGSNYPATYISDSTDGEELIMSAYVNGYTVAKEKKYLVYKKLGDKHTADVQYAQAYLTSVHSKILWIITSRILTNDGTDESFFQFTESEIQHYGLQDCEKKEVTDDEQ